MRIHLPWPPLRKGGKEEGQPDFFPPPSEGGTRGSSAVEDFERVQANCYDAGKEVRQAFQPDGRGESGWKA